MKTLKKTLCLVLAVVMVVGVLVLPANAAATTTEDTDATAAFKTLNEYGVMYGVDANHKPALDKNINRQDMAAIVYRIMTGDTTDKYVANYVGSAAKFADSATFDTWAKGYIGYVRNNGIFMGDEKGNFKPKDYITGDEVLTVLLRCIGYGKNNEFTGANWAENAEAQATRIHLFGNAEGYKDVKTDMSKVISRGIVAKLTFNAVQAPMVTYFNGEPSIYQDNQGRPVAPNTPDAKTNPSLISTGSNSATATVAYDKWGAPSKTVENYVYFNYLQTKVTQTTKTELKPLDEFWTPKTECDVSAKIGLNKTATGVIVCTNGIINKSTTSLTPTNTTGRIGGQGRWTRVYDVDGNKAPDLIVYVDTVLAQVTKVTAHTEDAAGHVKNPATMTLEVYLSDTAALDDGEQVVQSKAATDKTDFTYAKGDYVLVNYIQDGADTAAVSTNKTVTETYALDQNVFVTGQPTTVTGKQTTIHFNDGKHTIDGKEYLDQLRFHLDQAGTSTGNYTWLFDSKGNLIGDVLVPAATSYGVITKMWWSGSATDGTGKAMADVVYMDGSKATIAIDDMTVYTNTAGTAVSDTNYNNTNTLRKGKAAYSLVNTDVMTVTGDVTATDGKFYVATDAATNAAMDNDSNHGTAGGNNDIIAGHLFLFTADGDKYDAKEVAGVSGKTGTEGTNYNDPDRYPNTFGNVASTAAAILKNVTAVGSVTKINSATKFLIRSGSEAAGWKFTPVTGFENISNYPAVANYEHDFVDLDLDGFAEYVYITAPAENSVAVRTFYTSDRAENGLDYSWNLSYSLTGSVYTINGYVDGVYGSIKTTDKTNVVDVIVGYEGAASNQVPQHKLWAVVEKDGYVTAVIDLQCASAPNPDTPRDPVGSTAVALATYAVNAQYRDLDATTPIPTTSIYSGAYLVAKTADDDDSFENNVLSLDSEDYTYVAGESIVVGDTANLDGKIVSLVYNNTTKKIVIMYVVDPDTGNTPTPVTKLSEKVAAAATATTSGTVAVTYSEGENEETIRSTIVAALEKAGYTDIQAKLNSNYSAANGEDTKYSYTGKITVGGVAHTYDIAVTATVYYQVILHCSGTGVNIAVDPVAIYLDKNGKPAAGVANSVTVTITADSGMPISSQTVTTGAQGTTPTFTLIGSASATKIEGTLSVSGLTSVTRATIIQIALS